MRHFRYEKSLIIYFEAFTSCFGSFLGDCFVTLDLISSYIFDKSELLLLELFTFFL